MIDFLLLGSDFSGAAYKAVKSSISTLKENGTYMIIFFLKTELEKAMEDTHLYFVKFAASPVQVLVFFLLSGLIMLLFLKLMKVINLKLIKEQKFIPGDWDLIFSVAFLFFYIFSHFPCYKFLKFITNVGDDLLRLILYWFVNILFCSLIFFLLLYFKKAKNIKVLGIRSISFSQTFGTIFGYFSFLPCYFIVFLSAHIIFATFGIVPPVQKVALELLKSKNELLYLGIITVGIIAPLTEEIIFRMFLYTGIRKLFGVKFAIIVTSLIFAIMHQNLFAILPIFALGVFLNLLYEKSQTIWLPVLAHFLHNNLTLLYIFLFMN